VISNGINFIDLAGAEWLTHEVKKWKARGGGIYFAGLKIISQDVLKKGGFVATIGEENFFRDKKTAIHKIYEKLDKNICSTCSVKAFEECQ